MKEISNIRSKTLSLFFLFMILSSTPLHAKLYQCENSRGVLEYTNMKGAGNCVAINSHEFNGTYLYQCRNRFGELEYTNMKYSDNCKTLRSYELNGTFTAEDPVEISRSGARAVIQPALIHSDQYDNHINRIGALYNVDSDLIKAVVRAESDFNCYAVSKKGAQGLMQLMPATARELKVDNPFDPHANIDGGTRYLKKLLSMFNGNLSLTLAAYNAGPTLVKSINRIPRIPETIKYVRRVLGYYKRYKNNYAMNIPSQSVIKIQELIKD